MLWVFRKKDERPEALIKEAMEYKMIAKEVKINKGPDWILDVKKNWVFWELRKARALLDKAKTISSEKGDNEIITDIIQKEKEIISIVDPLK